jgi:hypothetical protein
VENLRRWQGGGGPPAPPKVRDVTSWMLRHPDLLDEDEKLTLKQVKEHCPHPTALQAGAGPVSR